jgi:hypothetical protein
VTARQLQSRVIIAVGAVLALSIPSGVAQAKQPWTGPVPKARCGPHDRPETGLQGQTSVAERESGLAYLGFNCNLELVGQFQGEGASYGFDWYRDCAYYGTANTPEQRHPGVVVVNASKPRAPRATAYLDSRAMLEPWESLKVHRKRRLLGANKGPGGPDDRFFAFYDVSDCDRPVLLSELEVPEHIGHAGAFAPDGRTYYGTYIQGRLTAVDVANPRRPRVLHITSDYPVHDLAFNADGTRAYMANIGNSPSFPNPNGLVIADVSDIERRRPNPRIRTISTLFWNDGSTAQQALPVTFRGRPHLVFMDERGAFGAGQAAEEAACAQGLPPHGFARIIDIGNERRPRIISKLMLEVSDPANCAELLADPDRYSYSSHYCGVDRTRNPRWLACSWRDGGLRVFDIRNPYRPREIAYYKPPARGTAFLPGSIYWKDALGGNRTGDQTPSNVRFRRYKGEMQLWFTSQDNGFQIVRFTNGVLKR